MPGKLFRSAILTDATELPRIDASVAHIANTHEWRPGSGDQAGDPGVLWAGVARKP
jgi:hypothetical protein